ncbi:MAG: hypothetical protein ACK4UZ_13470 [Rhizobium rhizophilum]|uniref:hypothetical protein n=1 Tax=Tepidimonas sp. TaxID=2002775 RepID=UPI00391ACA49
MCHSRPFAPVLTANAEVNTERQCEFEPLQSLAVLTTERVRDVLRRDILTHIGAASIFGLAVALPAKLTHSTYPLSSKMITQAMRFDRAV